MTSRGARVDTIDVVRAAVMALMALDHVRVFSGVPAGGPTAAVFLTRWVTHFCAPAFFFLAGTSAFLRGEGGTASPSRSRWLVTRGLVLVALELTVIRVSWTFNLDYAHYVLAGVIWSLGWCMVLLAAIVKLPLGAIASLGLAIIAGHNLIPLLIHGQPAALLATPAGPLLRILYFGGPFAVGGTEPNVFVLYSLVPWVGVMSAGYAFGSVMARAPAERREACLRWGLAATLAFLALRGLQLYGDHPWRTAPGEQAWAPAWIRFLATTKYPASLQFLLMTLGPTLIALGALEGAIGPATRAAAVFGRVPMFYYLLHIPVIHLVALVLAVARAPASVPWLFANHPMNPPDVPAGYAWPLPLVYAVTALVVVALIAPCRWYAGVKAARRWGWTSYI